MGWIDHLPFVQLCLIIIILTVSSAQRCPPSARTEYNVAQCPENEESTKKRAQIKGCERIEGETCNNSSKFTYHCLPTDRLGTLVEVCAVEKYIYGVCVFYNNTQLQTDNNINCSQSSSCPGRFLSSEAHLYEPCKTIELSSTIPSTNKTVTFVPEDKSEVYTTVAILVAAILFFCIGLAIFIIKRWKDRRKRKSRVKETDGCSGQEEHEQLIATNYAHSEQNETDNKSKSERHIFVQSQRKAVSDFEEKVEVPLLLRGEKVLI
ncbi:uncharacterized protein LOC134257484 [Saccostrea cucullata]|uniref:uncharacterized protein LOC134257484 n=1 Tax=Saccostrea cuccullata TaxID=36930 RepID=UPI002ED1D4BB